MFSTVTLRELPCRVAGLAAVWLLFAGCVTSHRGDRMERVIVSPDKRGFVLRESRRPFVPWGVNYGNAGRLMEDFWTTNWQTIVEDFREIKAMGGNVARVHLQLGSFMRTAERPDEEALKQLGRMLALAEGTGLYLDVTGLACYRTSDVPAWYDALDDEGRWRVQETFWRAVAATCARSPAVFCYDLMNEPISPAGKSDKWYSGHLLGGYDFIQYIAKNPGGQSREALASAWIQRMTAAIRSMEKKTLVTVGLLPWVTDWKHLSGFVPGSIAPHVDFISVHIYPKTDLPEEAPFALRECAVGKPVVIEETFALTCSVQQLEEFLRDSRDIACGWIWHYDGITVAEYDQMEAAGTLTLPQSMWRENLRAFQRLKPEFTSKPKL